MTKVTIFIPVYNTEQFIADAIESVLNQTFTEFELIIVDDASTDDTYSICQHYADSDRRIRLYRNDINLGMMKNWNYGLSLSNSKYWGKLDADDVWLPEFVECCVSVLDKNDTVGLVCSKHILINEDGELIKGSESSPPDFVKDKSFSFLSIVKSERISFLKYDVCRQGVGLFRSDLFEKLGVFEEIAAGDTEMYFRVGGYSKIYFVNTIYHYHRIWSKSFTRTQVLNKVGQAEKELNLVRTLILNRYFQMGYLMRLEYWKLRSQNEFEFLKFKIYQARTNHNFTRMILYLCFALLIQPLPFFKFYLHRLTLYFKNS